MKKLWLIWLLLCLPALARPEQITDHIVLLDVSGSMRTRGYATVSGWAPTLPQFLRHLMTPGDSFGESDTIVVQPFSEEATDLKEHRVPFGPFTLAEWPDKLEDLPLPGGGATDMDRALSLGQRFVEQSGHRCMIWLITDNENNLNENQSDAKFYQRLRDSQEYSHVYFFPIADPSARPNDNLVMYMLAPAKQWETPQIERIAQEVKQKTEYEGILFRPLYVDPGGSPLDFSKELTMDGALKERVTQEGGTTVLHFEEGERLRGNLRFKIRSRLRGWRVTGARLQDAVAELNIPKPYASAGQKSVKWELSKRELSVGAQGDSADFFLLTLKGPEGRPLELSRPLSSRLANPTQRYLPEIKGKVKMSAELDLAGDQLKPDIPEEVRARLAAVPNLAEIEKYMTMQSDALGSQGNKRVIEWERKIVIKVKADPLPAILMGLFVLLGGGALLAVGLAAFTIKQTYELEGPGIQEEVQLPYLSGRYLVCSAAGHALCTLRTKLGALSIVAEPDTVLTGGEPVLPVRWEGDEFRFEVGPEGKSPLVMRLHRRSSRSESGDSGGPVL